MFIDASAFCSMLTNEEDARELLARMELSGTRVTSPLAIWETVIAVGRVLGLPLNEVRGAVEEYLSLMDIEVIAVPPEAGPLAIEAFERYGKARHPANLNFGDCFAYACARHHAVPLLYKGGDFAQTDIEPA